MTLTIVIYYPSFLSSLTVYVAQRPFTNVIVFHGGAKVTSLQKFRVLTSCLMSRELSQPMGKTEFSSTVKNRTLSHRKEN